MGVRDSSIFFPVAERIDILCRSREKGNVPFAVVLAILASTNKNIDRSHAR